MLVLSIETSTARSSVCLARPEGVVAAATLRVPQRHTEFLAPAIAFCLTQGGVSVDAVTGVAVGTGPGLFTGLRVGLATARSFAAALRLPVVGLCGLDVLAFRARHARRLICSALDARRGEVFWAFYRCSPGGVQRASDLSVGAPDALAAEIESAGEECLVLGDGGMRYADLLVKAGAVVGGPETDAPDAADLAELAVPRFEREEGEHHSRIEPIYLRKVDAKIGWETRGRMHGGVGASAPGSTA